MKLQSKIVADLGNMGPFLAPKPSDMAMSSRAMIVKTQRSIIFKAQ